MVLVTETIVLRILKDNQQRGLSNINISKEILRQKRNDDPNLESIKVLVSRKTKKLAKSGDIKQNGRTYYITEKGLTQLSTRTFARTTWGKPKIYENMHVSFAGPQRPNQIIYENRELDETLKKLDKILGDEEVMLLIRKNVSRETSKEETEEQ